MNVTKLFVSLAVPAAMAMLMALAGCGSDHHDYGRDRGRSPEVERRDNDRHDEHHDNDRRDDERGGR